MYLIYGGFGIKGPNVGHSRLDNLIEMKRSVVNGKWNIEELKVSGNGPGTLNKVMSCDDVDELISNDVPLMLIIVIY